MSDKPILDKRAVRRSFDRAADTYDAAAVLQHEVCRRSLERLGVSARDLIVVFAVLSLLTGANA